MIDFTAKCEELAEKATQNCTAFKKVNLRLIKDKLATILNAIGREGMFDEYTLHNITHVDGVLQIVDKIITDSTSKIMTDADWLLIVLSVYFHDLGMFIPKKEFEDRNDNREFVALKDKLVPKSDPKWNNLSEDQKERYLYQEYVRKNHGKRVRLWLTDRSSIANYGFSKELDEMFNGVSPDLLEQVALVCESHNLDDISTDTLETDYAFGTTDKEVGNVFFAAILLRTADLLHVTSDRAPSTEFNIIDVQNPVSQLEWAKQGFVRSVRVKHTDSNGDTPDDFVPTQFEIQATFEDPEAYFAFDSYLNYAEKEIKKCHKLCTEVNKNKKLQYDYPWTGIYRGRIIGKNFETKKLNFEIDKERILKLLMGHTLYNDSTVVIRELVQNGIDACRLYNFGLKEGTSYTPTVKISWSSEDRTLTVQDNGTGMSRDTIFNHLLMVGSSRYQDESFKKEYPKFHSISRFGIGLLTCFMISDNIDIYTKEKNCNTKKLSIRNLHGNFIMKDVKDNSFILDNEHGSTFILKVRESINDLTNFEDIVRKWIILPEVKVLMSVDGRDTEVGFASGEDAIYSFVAKSGITKDNEYFKVRTVRKENTVLSCLLKKDKNTDVWQFATYNDIGTNHGSPVGICIEGIRVTARTPGYDHSRYIAVVNCKGDSAPNTNVSRTSIEDDERNNELLEFIYASYLKIIEEQIINLEGSHSFSWASEEAMYLLNQICNDDFARARLENRTIFLHCIEDFPMFVLENEEERSLLSFNDMPDYIGTIENRAFNSACNLLMEVQDQRKTALSIMQYINHNYDIGFKNILDYNAESLLIDDMFFNHYQICDLKTIPETRTLKLGWEKGNDKWVVEDVSRLHFQDRYKRLIIPLSNDSFKYSNENHYLAVDSEFGCILMPDNKLWEWLVSKYTPNMDDSQLFHILALYIAASLSSPNYQGEDGLRHFFNSFVGIREISKSIDLDDAVNKLPTSYNVFRISDYYKHFGMLN